MIPNHGQSLRIVAPWLLGAILCSALMGRDWHGVIKQNAAIGWARRTMAAEPTDDDFSHGLLPNRGTGTEAGMKISLDGRNLSPAFLVASNGTFTLPLPPILVSGRHRIFATQAAKSKLPVEANPGFTS